jgi:hypothetical protein
MSSNSTGARPARCAAGSGGPSPRRRWRLRSTWDVGHHVFEPALGTHDAEVRLEGGERIVSDLGFGGRDGGSACSSPRSASRPATSLSFSSRAATLLAALPLLGGVGDGCSGTGRCPVPWPPAAAEPIAGMDHVGQHRAIAIHDDGAFGTTPRSRARWNRGLLPWPCCPHSPTVGNDRTSSEATLRSATSQRPAITAARRRPPLGRGPRARSHPPAPPSPARTLIKHSSMNRPPRTLRAAPGGPSSGHQLLRPLLMG